jgi:two-component sensor histidine kinase
VNEILSNAYKHAFKGRKNGTIMISASQEDGWIRITIRDDGIGLPGKFDVSHSNGLGIQLVKTLVEHQLKGSLAFTCRQGTEIRIEFPALPAGA